MLSIKKLTFNHITSYLIAVTLGFVFDFCIYCILVKYEMSPYIANSFSFFAGAIFTVLLLRTFVFKINKFHLLKDILFTLSSNGTIYFLGMIFLYCCINFLYIGPYFSKIVTNILTFFINYIIRLTFFSGH
jgi:putative flippase GtrA